MGPTDSGTNKAHAKYVTSLFIGPLIDVSSGQSRNRAGKVVETILALQKTQASCDGELQKLEMQLLQGSGDPLLLDMQLKEMRARRARIITAIQRKRAALGLDERAQLSRLAKSKFLQLRMNACALKQRIRDRLRQRKFELDRLERSHRQTVNSECSLWYCRERLM